MSDSITCAIHQPNVFPRLATLAKLYAADVWVVLDDVQFNARDYQHRAWLAGADPLHGQWLSLPVRRPFGRATHINEVVLLERDKSARRVAHLTRRYFGAAPRWAVLRPVVDQVSAAIQLSTYLVDIGELSTRLLLEDMGWHGTVVRSSAFAVRQERSARLADLTVAVGASAYLCGTGGRSISMKCPLWNAACPCCTCACQMCRCCSSDGG
jgi:hypothetical protein